MSKKKVEIEKEELALLLFYSALFGLAQQRSPIILDILRTNVEVLRDAAEGVKTGLIRAIERMLEDTESAPTDIRQWEELKKLLKT